MLLIVSSILTVVAALIQTNQYKVVNVFVLLRVFLHTGRQNLSIKVMKWTEWWNNYSNMHPKGYVTKSLLCEHIMCMVVCMHSACVYRVYRVCVCVIVPFRPCKCPPNDLENWLKRPGLLVHCFMMKQM